MKKKLSIIIPMYNAELFIERTIKSITTSNLSAESYDILIVNDGSTDKCVEIVERLKETKPNICLLNQENGGSSVARNTGMDNSEGEYIWFVDADDMVEKDLSIIMDLIIKYTEVDVFDFEYNWVNDKDEIFGRGSSHPSVVHNEIIRGRDAILQGYTPGSVCGLILKSSFLINNHLRFKVGITQQDVELTFRIFSYAPKVMFRHEVIYDYLIRNNSTSKALDAERRTRYECDKVEIIKSFHNLSKCFEYTDKELSNKIRLYADNALFGCVYTLFKNRKTWKPLGISKAVVDRMKQEGYYPLKGVKGSWKKQLACLLLNIEHIVS